MTLISLPYRASLVGGQPEKIAEILADFDAILNVVNGDLRNDNIASGAGLDIAKLAIGGTPSGSKFLRDDRTWQVPPGSVPLTSYNKTTPTDVVNTTTKTDVTGGAFNILANVADADSLILMDIGGEYLNSTGSVKQITLELKLGTQVLWDGGISDTISSAADKRGWRFILALQMLGTTASQMGQGVFSLGSNNAATTGVGALSVPSPNLGGVPFQTISGTTNMTSNQLLVLNVTHSVASPSISMKCTRGVVQVFS